MSYRGPRQIRSLLVVWLFVLSAIAFLDRTNISIAALTLRDELKIDDLHLGWIFSSFLVGYAAFQVVGGWLAFRFGPRLVLTAGVVWWGIFSALTTIASPKIGHVVLILIAIRFALGAGEAVIYPASNQFVAQWIPVRERGRANGWIFAGVGAGAGLSIPVLTWLISHYGWRSCFWFSAVIGVIAGAVWFAIARDMPEDHPLVSPDELKLIQATRLTTVVRHDQAPISWRAAILNRDIAALSLSYFSFGYVAWIFFSWFFIYLAQVRGLNLEGKRISFDDSVHCDDGLLSRWRTCKRRALEEIRTARRALRHRCGRLVAHGCLPHHWVPGHQCVCRKHHSWRRSRRALPLAEFLLVGQRGPRGRTLRRGLGRHEHVLPDRRRGHRVPHSIPRHAIWMEERISLCCHACYGWRHPVVVRRSRSPTRSDLSRFAERASPSRQRSKSRGIFRLLAKHTPRSGAS